MLKRPRTIGFGIFVVSLVVYLALAARMTRAWVPLGDEPHYLLAAYSLVHDGDLNLANNYAERDFETFMEGESLDPHVKILPDGSQILNHDLGLPLLIAIPFALGGRAGVEIFLAVCGALLAWQMFEIAHDVTHSSLWATVAALALGFTPPLVMYAALVYPEVIGALIFIWSLRALVIRQPAGNSKFAIAAFALATVTLPWLSIRFVVLDILLMLFAAFRWREQPARAVLGIVLTVVSLAVYFFVNSILLAGTVPAGNPTELASGNLTTLSVTSLARGVLGWWIDPQRGTLILAPIYLLALAGIPRLLRTNFKAGMFLLAAPGVLVPLVAMLGGFWIPFEVGARYFVVVLPLLAAPLAVALRDGLEARGQARLRRFAFGATASLLALLSFWNGALMISDASYAYGSVVSAYSRAVGSDLSIFFAGMGHGVLVTPSNALPTSMQPGVTVQERDGELVWHTAEGNAGTIIQSFDLTELTVGNYDLEFRAAVDGMRANDESVAVELYSAEGLPLVHSTLDGASPMLAPYAINFNNPYFDRWGFPLTLQVTTNGTAEVWLSALTFDPDTFYTWVRIGLWVGLLVVTIVLFNLDLFERKRF